MMGDRGDCTTMDDRDELEKEMKRRKVRLAK
jgi:hypothetical protein